MRFITTIALHSFFDSSEFADQRLVHLQTGATQNVLVQLFKSDNASVTIVNRIIS